MRELEEDLKFLNEFEQKLITTNLSGFVIEFNESVEYTIITVTNPNSNTTSTFHTFTLDIKGNRIKKDLKKLCEDIVEHFNWADFNYNKANNV